MKRFLIAAVMLPMLASSALAESSSNIFLSGKVFKGDEVVASFAAPTLLGNTLPVKDQVLHSYIEKAVSDGKKTKLIPGKLVTGLDMTMTPTAVVGENVIVAVKGSLAVLEGFDKAPLAGTDLAIDLPKMSRNEFSQSFEVKKGQPLEFAFGGCTLFEGTPTNCSHKLVLDASAHN